MRDASTRQEPLWHLLYRFWFWHWLFEDITRGDLLRRAAAWRHNVEKRIHLPVYLRRWLVNLAVLLACGAVLERSTLPPTVSAAFYTGAVLALMVQINAMVAWFWLSHMPPPGGRTR